MNEVIVKAENVSKIFCRSLKKSLWYGVKDIGKEIVGRRLGNHDKNDLRKDEFWAVDDVSFELKRGECLGLIGENGAGKSTLLKMLNGLIKPDRGRIEMRGRVGALIQLGAGFNPILTGRENVYINASVLGFTKSEIDKKFDAIVEFAEIGEFIDMPVQNYSSGMKVRLGFAVASQMEPDILLIDEVLAVGDMGFVIKCLNAINKIMKNAAVIFVSHSMPHISRICNKVIVMEEGRSVFNDTDLAKGIDMYFSKFKSPITNYSATDKAEILDIRLSSSSNPEPTEPKGNEEFTLNYLDDFIIDLDLKIDKTYKNPAISLTFYNLEMRNIAESFFHNENGEIKNNNGNISVRAIIPKLNFNKGVYTITVGISERTGGEMLLRAQAVKEFQVLGDVIGWGVVRFDTLWQEIDGNY